MAETIGQQLKHARLARNLTLEKVVQATHIRAHQIEAIEADDFEALPSPVQARAFLRLYVEYLGLSLDELIAHQHEGISKLPGTLPDDSTNSGQTLEPTPPSLTETVKIETRLRWPRLPGHQKNGAKAESTPSPEESFEGSPLPEPVPAEPVKSQLIFTAIGATLRQRRETLSLTFDEIERHTHVRKYYLQALEAGEFDNLPSSVQARGMLNNYAHFLDMDVDNILSQFAEGLQTKRLEGQPQSFEKTDKHNSRSVDKFKMEFKVNIPTRLRRYFTMDIFVGIGLVLLLIVLAVWGTSRIIGFNAASTPQPTAPSISDILINSPGVITATPSLAVGESSGTGTPVGEASVAITLPAAGQGAVQILIVARESAWVRVTVDGKVKFEERVTAGTVYPFDGNTQIEILTGNGAAISIIYNQSDMGPLGSFGEVVDRIYTNNAILNPTPTFTPTPTKTPIPSATPRPSATLRPSITPRISPTP